MSAGPHPLSTRPDSPDRDRIRTALAVARAGTVSGAAAALGVHHATVIRHVDALEAELGVRLFQRHARGYTPTDAGAELLRLAGRIESDIGQMVTRLRERGSDVAGELVLTSLESFVPDLMPILADFLARYRALRLRYVTGPRLLQLAQGEAHVAIRAGQAPSEPDNVVQPLARLAFGLHAAPACLARHGRPPVDAADLAGDGTGPGPAAFRGHRFVTLDPALSLPAPHGRWLARLAGEPAPALLASDTRMLEDAVRAGIGLGFLPVHAARARGGLEEVLPPQPAWAADLWLVTHVDLHRSAKVQALVNHLRDTLPQRLGAGAAPS